MVTHHRLVFPLLVVCTLAAAPSAQQPSQSDPPPEASDLGAGWAHLAAGRANQAIVIAGVALERSPGSLAAATLLVHAEMVQRGAVAGLAAYERWLGSKPIEDPYLLRVVARGVLREAVRAKSASGDAQRRAFQALYADGDLATLTALRNTTQPVGLIERQMLGALGSEEAVRGLVASLRELPDDRTRAINALRDTRSPLAVQAITEVLSDPLATNRMAAADALGQMGATQAIGALRQLLSDPQFAPRFSAARALFRLGDLTAAPFLISLQSSEHALVRAQALEATASDPNGLWMSSVNVLLADPDAMVRLIAARLIAPHDPAAAARATQDLMRDENIAVRQAAERTYVENVVTDVRSLRQFLHSADPLVRVSAADRVLELTR